MSGRVALRQALARGQVLAILRYRSGGDAMAAVDALIEGGVQVLEITMDTPGAREAIKAYADREDVRIGAGTVTTVAEVQEVAELGATFIVSPGFDADVVEAAHRLGLGTMPGVTTTTEIMMARHAGVELFKLFPAGALGVDYLAQIRGPFGEEAFVPTGGVQVDDIGAWLDAGAFAVALGSDLAGRSAPSTAADRARLTERARAVVAQIAGRAERHAS